MMFYFLILSLCWLHFRRELSPSLNPILVALTRALNTQQTKNKLSRVRYNRVNVCGAFWLYYVCVFFVFSFFLDVQFTTKMNGCVCISFGADFIMLHNILLLLLYGAFFGGSTYISQTQDMFFQQTEAYKVYGIYWIVFVVCTMHCKCGGGDVDNAATASFLFIFAPCD